MFEVLGLGNGIIDDSRFYVSGFVDFIDNVGLVDVDGIVFWVKLDVFKRRDGF